MTNEEAIEGFKMDNLMLQGRNNESVIERNNIAIKSLQENTKLKAEIEQLKKNIIDSANEIYTTQKLDHELLIKEIKHLQSTNAKLCEEIAELKRFKQYFDELYGTGLEVANWHLNGDLESLDNFMDYANDYMRGKESNI